MPTTRDRGVSVPRHVMWRRQYDHDRYMEYLSHAELLQRLKDILANFLELTADVKLGLHLTDEGKRWLVLFTHVLEEFQLRFGPYPAGFSDGFMADAQIPRPDSPLATLAVEAVQRREVALGTYLVKYNRSQYLRPALEHGIVRISPATFYNDPSLNPALRDNELELSIYGRADKAKIELRDKQTHHPIRAIHPVGNITLTGKMSTNYYVYCISEVLAPRLFLDFRADSCLLIANPQAFIERLLRKVADQLPGWAGLASMVRYIDPLRSKASDLDPLFGKHCRYAYQREYRVLWLPPEPINELSYIMVELGNLEECCELIELSASDDGVRSTAST